MDMQMSDYSDIRRHITPATGSIMSMTAESSFLHIVSHSVQGAKENSELVFIPVRGGQGQSTGQHRLLQPTMKDNWSCNPHNQMSRSGISQEFAVLESVRRVGRITPCTLAPVVNTLSATSLCIPLPGSNPLKLQLPIHHVGGCRPFRQTPISHRDIPVPMLDQILSPRFVFFFQAVLALVLDKEVGQ